MNKIYLYRALNPMNNTYMGPQGYRTTHNLTTRRSMCKPVTDLGTSRPGSLKINTMQGLGLYCKVPSKPHAGGVPVFMSFGARSSVNWAFNVWTGGAWGKLVMSSTRLRTQTWRLGCNFGLWAVNFTLQRKESHSKATLHSSIPIDAYISSPASVSCSCVCSI